MIVIYGPLRKDRCTKGGSTWPIPTSQLSWEVVLSPSHMLPYGCAIFIVKLPAKLPANGCYNGWVGSHQYAYYACICVRYTDSFSFRPAGMLDYMADARLRLGQARSSHTGPQPRMPDLRRTAWWCHAVVLSLPSWWHLSPWPWPGDPGGERMVQQKGSAQKEFGKNLVEWWPVGTLTATKTHKPSQNFCTKFI